MLHFHIVHRATATRELSSQMDQVPMLCSYMDVDCCNPAQLLGLDTTSMALCLRSIPSQIQFCLLPYLALELLEMLLFIPFFESFITVLKYVVLQKQSKYLSRCNKINVG